MSRPLAPLAAALMLALTIQAAHASLRLCNRTSYVLYAATAVAEPSDVAVKGWTRIAPGGCSTAIHGDLAASAYYVYARVSQAYADTSRAWAGNTNFCVKDADFSLRLPPLFTYCPSADAYEIPFAAIDTHHMRSWTTTFRESPDFDSMRSAERAGLKRLLNDNGARIDRLGSGSDKAEAVALAAFRKRMHLSTNAGAADLFNALETEAMRTAIPVGYSVCNDTNKPFWVALGQKRDRKWVSRGWWTVAAGGCAKVIAGSIAGEKIFLYVERSKDKALVSGPTGFCVTSIEFEIEGRERCAARGLTEDGFAQTNVNGARGFVAHVSEDGLALSASMGTPK